MSLRTMLAVVLIPIASVILLAQAPTAEEPAIKYPLTPREGPWLIHVASFRGDQSLEFAHRLAEEVRTKHRLLSFIYSMNEEDAKRDREQLKQYQMQVVGTDKVAGTDERQKFKTVRIVKEYSVFVGNFSTMEKAREQTEDIKAFPPPTSIPEYGLSLFNESNATSKADPQSSEIANLFKLKTTTRSEDRKLLSAKQGNPFRQAFVVRNPFLAKSKVATVVNQNAPVPMDSTWPALNEKEKYSIFTNTKPWTLVVAKFAPPTDVRTSPTGSVVQAGVGMPGQNLGRGLEASAETARQVADLLRDGGKGYDAYVFHTQQYSLVTVGAFDSRYDPKMEQAWMILKDFAESQQSGPFSLLLKMPLPMQIPGR